MAQLIHTSIGPSSRSIRSAAASHLVDISDVRGNRQRQLRLLPSPPPPQIAVARGHAPADQPARPPREADRRRTADASTGTSNHDDSPAGFRRYASLKAMVDIRANAGWRESSRVCCTTIGTDDSITLE